MSDLGICAWYANVALMSCCRRLPSTSTPNCSCSLALK